MPRQQTPSAGEKLIRDAPTLRALANPIRYALYELVVASGSLTATDAAAIVGQSPTTCSFHLRQLARYGLIEDVDVKHGRSRPWRARQVGLRVLSGDRGADLAATALAGVMRQRVLARLGEWDEEKSAWPDAWQRSADEADYLLYLTLDELTDLKDRLHDLVAPYVERLADPTRRPVGAMAVEAVTFLHPVGSPPSDGSLRAPRTTRRT
ncbi:MAG: ArsR/SmtB family transcription factor [Acidimicrobiales bacterium]